MVELGRVGINANANANALRYALASTSIMILPRLTLLFGMHLFLVKKKIMSLILLVQYLIVQLDSTCHLINHSEET